jgi:hypothetical protein
MNNSFKYFNGNDILCSQVQTCVFVIHGHTKHVLGYIHNGLQVYRLSNGDDILYFQVHTLYL